MTLTGIIFILRDRSKTNTMKLLVFRGTLLQSACPSRESLWSANFYSAPSHNRSADILKLVSYLLMR
jgi:hypothetical protein